MGKVFYYAKNSVFKANIPLTFSSFEDQKIKQYVWDILDRNIYDWIVLDGLHLAACFLHDGELKRHPNGGKVLYRAHNIESDLWQAVENKSRFPLKRMFLRRQKELVKRFEIKVLENCDLVAPISEEDQTWIRKESPNTKTSLAVLGMDFSRPLEYPPYAYSNDGSSLNKNQFLFLGKLDWPPNKDGLRWFLDKVWPYVDKNRACLHIAGSGDSKWLMKYIKQNGDNGICFHGFVDDIDALYAKCHGTIAPIFYGSGTRIKVVESYAKGRSIITTALGAQGTGLCSKKSFFKAQGPKEWIRTLNEFDVRLGMSYAANGIEQLSKSFDERKVAQNLLMAMN